MLVTANIEQKIIGNKQLFSGLKLAIERREKIAIIGRNGVGKTSLFSMLTGRDTDYAGSIVLQPGTSMIATEQEHSDIGDTTVMEYILSRLPDYTRLKDIIEHYPETMGIDERKIHTYSEALERFGVLDYFTIEDKILQLLDSYQLDGSAEKSLASLSGGQKRFVELICVELALADLALIDEPTNHMDYVAKAAFLDWFKSVKQTVVVISHDRDVLQYVDRILEIKDGHARSYNGNYSAYLKQNAHSTSTKMHDYEITQRQIANLREKVIQFRRLKEKARDPDTIKQFKRRELTAAAELAELEKIEKPNFWIDRESAEQLNKKVSENYDKFKSKSIKLHKTSSTEQHKELLCVEDLQLGYDQTPLFRPIKFLLNHEDRLHLIGRNGAGKTTLVRAIVAAAAGKRSSTWRAGSIFPDKSLRLSVYEQEAGAELLELKLYDAIEQIYRELNVPYGEQAIMGTMSNYLFNPHEDRNILVRNLSGGQKARLQIIKMLAGNPNLLVLDEPTNHLDLPSIEELENALKNYTGALLYVSHDSYLAKHLGGKELVLASSSD